MMALDDVHMPKLRFPEFEGAWEEKLLGRLMTFKNGVNADKSMYGSGHKFINVMDIIADHPITHESIIGRVSISKSEFKKNEVTYGDILFQRSSEVREETGQSNVYLDRDTSATFGGFVIRGKPTTLFDPKYFNALLATSKARKDITSRSGGSTRYNVGQDSLSKVIVNVAPSLPEQKKVAAFLGAVDGKLAALREKEAALTRFKTGLMQALFNQTLRFTRDDGGAFPDWEDTTIGEVGTFYYGKSAPKFSLSPDAPTLCVRYGELYSKYDMVIDNPTSRTNIDPSSLRFSKGGEILVPRVGEDPLDFARNCCLLSVPNVAIGEMISVYNTDQNALFYTYYFRQLTRQFAYVVEGGSVSNLYYSYLEPIGIGQPHPEEQQKIADALSAMDAKIAAVGEQITRLDAFKKGLLQQMFV